MGIFSWFKTWRVKRRTDKLLAGLPKYPPATPGIDWGGEKFPPTFGQTTKAKPRPGEPDVDLAEKTQRLLLGYGRIKPKKIAEARLVLTYGDGEVQDLERWYGPMRVLISPSGKVDYAIIIERSLFYIDAEDLPKGGCNSPVVFDSHSMKKVKSHDEVGRASTS